jgi:UDP-GlcNAc3NAcA epimerase
LAVKPLKLATVVGARPQFVKAAAVSRAIVRHNASGPRRAITEVLIHTGQHYDDEMSGIFFAELGLPAPTYHLSVGSGSHAAQTGEMLKRLEAPLLAEQPDVVLVYGDTNSTLAGALVAAKLHMPLAHVEAGLRSLNRRMPEEINRVLTDHVSALLFCPSAEAVRNLSREGIADGVHVVGDVMYDVLCWQMARADTRRTLDRLGLEPRNYVLATVHRAENTDDPARLRSILEALQALAYDGSRVVLPLHPRTRVAMSMQSLTAEHLLVIPPASYDEMLVLEANAKVILTDSGGVQKEAYWLGVPCVTLRDETEWTETVSAGWNTLAGSDPERIVHAARHPRPVGERPPLYGDGDAAGRVVAILGAHESQRN